MADVAPDRKGKRAPEQSREAVRENSLKTVVQDSIVRLGFRDGPESAIAEGFRRVSKCFTGRHGGYEAKARLLREAERLNF